MPHLQTRENPGAGTPGLEAQSKNSHLEITASRKGSQWKSGTDSMRLRYLARQLHALGPRPIYEFLREIEAGADVRTRLEAYAAIPAGFVRANGGDKFPPAAFAVTGDRANG